MGDETRGLAYRQKACKPVKVIRFCLVLVALTAPAAADSKAKPELLEAETTAWKTAKPALDRACASCHTKAGAKATNKTLGHFAFDSYPPTGHHAATIGATVRDVLGLGKKKATMPFKKPGSVTGDDLTAIKTWIDAWLAADKAGAHAKPAGHHHH